MKYFHRLPAAAAALALAAPAFAHTGHHNSDIIATVIHWLAQPTHGLPVLVLAALTALAIYAKRARG